MDIIICGFDSENLTWLKESCADLNWVVTESENNDCAHIVISDEFFDPTAYVNFLKLHKGKRFLLHPSISKNVIENIVLLLKQDHVEAASGFMPPELRARYNDSVYEKIVLLDQLTKKIDNESLKNIRSEIHKIAGSAGSFGYPEMTTLSRKIELELNTLLEGGSKMSNDEIQKMLVDYQNSLKLAFQNILHI